MRASEFVVENASVASTTAGSIAPVAQPLGKMLTRNQGSFFTGKNTTDAFPNTPYKKKTKTRFQNSR
jgi:uncharacterized pyridoxamine 5'-phosphate oxidase family protein